MIFLHSPVACSCLAEPPRLFPLRLTELARRVSSVTESWKNGALRPALLGATLALVVNAAATMWSNYLTRRDQHVQEADKCNEVAASLISTTSFARDAARAAASGLAEPIPSGAPSQRFVLPPIDEILRSQDQSLTFVDPTSRNIIFQLEAYYRAVRDDLSHTVDVKAEGDTFSLLSNSLNREYYENLLRHLAEEAAAATESLDKSRHCDDLAKTSFFSSEPRPRPHVGAR